MEGTQAPWRKISNSGSASPVTDAESVAHSWAFLMTRGRCLAWPSFSALPSTNWSRSITVTDQMTGCGWFLKIKNKSPAHFSFLKAARKRAAYIRSAPRVVEPFLLIPTSGPTVFRAQQPRRFMSRSAFSIGGPNMRAVGELHQRRRPQMARIVS